MAARHNLNSPARSIELGEVGAVGELSRRLPINSVGKVRLSITSSGEFCCKFPACTKRVCVFERARALTNSDLLEVDQISSGVFQFLLKIKL